MSKRKKQKLAAKAEIPTKKKTTTAPVAGGWNSMANWFLVLIIILPVIFSKKTIDPVISVRFILLSVFMLLFTVFFSIKNKLQKVSLTPLSKAVFFAGIGFALWSLVSLFISLNPGAGYYETARNFLNIILLFLIMIMVRNEESKILMLCKALVIVSIFQSFVGILQYYEVAFTELPGNYKPYGLMANRNLFGSAQALLLPFTLYVIYRAASRWKWVAFAAVAGIFASLIISQTRSAWLAALLLLTISFVLVMIFAKSSRKKWLIGYAIGAAGAAGLIFILVKTDTDDGLSRSLTERALSISQPNIKSETHSAETISDRLSIWKKSIELLQDHPVIGVGMSNWKLVVPKYGSKGMSWEIGTYIPDRSHNVYLQVASETGIPGAVLYFGMWLLVAIIAFKTILKTQSEDKRVLLILMLGGLTAFAVDNMFSFAIERIEHALYISLTAGIILGLDTSLNAEKNIRPTVLKRGWLVATLIIIVFNIFIGIKKYNYEVHMNLAAAHEKAGNYNQVIAEVESGKSTWVTIDPEGKPIQFLSSIAYKNLKDYQKALSEGGIARKYSPHSAIILNNLGTVYTDMSQFDKAIDYYKKALELTPAFESVLKNLAVNYYQVGNYNACIETIEKFATVREPYFENMLNDARQRVAAKK